MRWRNKLLPAAPRMSSPWNARHAVPTTATEATLAMSTKQVGWLFKRPRPRCVSLPWPKAKPMRANAVASRFGMTLPILLLLAVVQGVAEFLPISSSGHLIVLGHWLNPSQGALPDLNDVNIVLHLGTLLSIIVFYWQSLLKLLTENRRVIWLMRSIHTRI